MADFLLAAFADEASQALEGQIKACKENGIAAIELRGVDGINISDLPAKDAKRLRERLDEAGLAVSSIGSKYGKEAFSFAAFQNTVEAALILGAPYIRMFSFFEGPTQQRLADVKTMADYAAARGVLCCHENEKGVYGDIPSRCKELLDHCEGRLGCIFDFANFMECGADPMEAYALLKPYITYFHIKDYSHSQGAVVPAGTGDGRLAEILADFDRSHAGPVWLSLEPHLKAFDGLSDFDRETQEKLAHTTLYNTTEESFAAAAAALHSVVKQVKRGPQANET